MSKGPLPKPPELRSRRNRVSTAARLPLEGRSGRIPELPRGRKWTPATRSWWRTIWRAPMASEYIAADVPGLLLLAALREEFARSPRPTLAGEIRQWEGRFGLSPADRRRLQWSVRRVETAHQPSPPSWPVRDPRSVLRVLVSEKGRKAT